MSRRALITCLVTCWRICLALSADFKCKGRSQEISSYTFATNITNRYESTLVKSHIHSCDSTQIDFFAIFPKNAFITDFVILDDKGAEYKSTVVTNSAEPIMEADDEADVLETEITDSRNFSVTVKVGKQTSLVFYLKYEQLLKRENNYYELVLNIFPQQIVNDLKAEVNINENVPLVHFKPTYFRTGLYDNIKHNERPSFRSKVLNATSSSLLFVFTTSEQQKLAKQFNGNTKLGLQFVVQFDVKWDNFGGPVLVQDQYFAHFFAGLRQKPVLHHVVFLLDDSVSMRINTTTRTKLKRGQQMKDAMTKILYELDDSDIFTIARFGSTASVFDINSTGKFQRVNIGNSDYGSLTQHLKTLNLPRPLEATQQNIKKANEAINSLRFDEATNIIQALEVGLFLSKMSVGIFPEHHPVIMFLSDGEINHHFNDSQQVLKTISTINPMPGAVPIYSVLFDINTHRKKFLDEISNRNIAKSKFISENSDAFNDLREFLRTITFALLLDVEFKYTNDDSKIANLSISGTILNKESELFVTGKTSYAIQPSVNGLGRHQKLRFNPTVQRISDGSLARIWAFTAIQKILFLISQDNNGTIQASSDLSLQYSFLTPLTSLLVVTPNGKVSANLISNAGSQPKWLRTAHKKKASITIPFSKKREIILVFPTCFNQLTESFGHCMLQTQCPQLLSRINTEIDFFRCSCFLRNDMNKVVGGVCCPDDM